MTIYYKMRQILLQNSFTTIWDKILFQNALGFFCYKMQQFYYDIHHDSYYKMQLFYYKTRCLLKCIDTLCKNDEFCYYNFFCLLKIGFMNLTNIDCDSFILALMTFSQCNVWFSENKCLYRCGLKLQFTVLILQ